MTRKIELDEDPYQRLLSVGRLRVSKANRVSSLQLEAASDRGRVLFSNAFRRMQSKTQVFDQEWNGAVRTRLTHSLEVATVGRYMTEMAVSRLAAGNWLGQDPSLVVERGQAMVTFVEVACLAHDIGNPPFGHFAEKTIQAWFVDQFEKFAAGYVNTPEEESTFELGYNDFRFFDGNAQGFRLVAKLQWLRDGFGFNLTSTQLAALLKYPWTPDRVGKVMGGKTVAKAGVFSTEAKELNAVRSDLGLDFGQRHPLAYLMEAADDISYCLSDIEDALEKNIVTREQFQAWMFSKLSRPSPMLASFLDALKIVDDKNTSRSAWFVSFRTVVTQTLVDVGAQLFEESQHDVLLGKYFDLLELDVNAATFLSSIKDFAKTHLYCSPIVRRRELVGFQVVKGLLDRFGLLLRFSTIEFQALLSRKGDFSNVLKTPNLGALTVVQAETLISYLPEKHVLAYFHACREEGDCGGAREWLLRAHLVVDFISGMTDDFAIIMHQQLYSGGPVRVS